MSTVNIRKNVKFIINNYYGMYKLYWSAIYKLYLNYKKRGGQDEFINFMVQLDIYLNDIHLIYYPNLSFMKFLSIYNILNIELYI